MAHQKYECVATGATSKATKDLLFRMNAKGWGLFVVERTEAKKVLPFFLQGNIVRNQIDDIRGFPDLIDFMLWNGGWQVLKNEVSKCVQD